MTKIPNVRPNELGVQILRIAVETLREHQSKTFLSYEQVKQINKELEELENTIDEMESVRLNVWADSTAECLACRSKGTVGLYSAEALNWRLYCEDCADFRQGITR